MIFFAVWTNRDPVFHYYDNEADILISPSGVPTKWSVSEWDILPRRLFIDSGAFSIKSTQPSCSEILDRQIQISSGWDFSRQIYFSHPDILIPINTSTLKTYQIIGASIARAKDYIKMFRKKKIRGLPIGVIHGFDEETILCSYYELKSFGYKIFALGSLAIRFSTNRELCLKAIETATNYGIKPLHLFGLTWPLIKECTKFSIRSFDSATPAKLGFFGTVLYGNPPRRYKIAPNASQRMHNRSFNFFEELDAPLPCECPVCFDNAYRIIAVRGTNSKKDRTLHNYFQLKWATTTLN